jgi:hypothetical protein
MYRHGRTDLIMSIHQVDGYNVDSLSTYLNIVILSFSYLNTIMAISVYVLRRSPFGHVMRVMLMS